MSEKLASRKRSFWSKVEAAGEGMEIGLRLLFGFAFAFFLCAAAFQLGSKMATAVGIVASAITFPFAFAVGFFWIEVKFFLRLVVHLIFGL